MMRARVLVTRPEPGASATAPRLREAGFEPVMLPLTEIKALPVEADAGRATDAVVVTSANAIRHAPSNLLTTLAEKPCFAVGEETARAAVEAGFEETVSARGDATVLADLAVAGTRPADRILYLTGKIRRPELEDMLAAAGRTVETVETYDTLTVAYSVDDLDRLLAGRIDAVLLHSARAAELLAGLSDASRRLPAAVFLGLSERIAAALPPALRKRFRAAGTPDEAALFRLLGEAFPPTP